MRRWLVIIAVIWSSCDETRVYEKNVDFEQQQWVVSDKPVFEVTIDDTQTPYNVYLNVRNSIEFPYSRLFVTYLLKDSVGNIVEKKLVNNTLFDPKTGKPHGTSGIGDVYDHQFPLLKSYRFSYPGIHKIELEQFMRKDSLNGVLAVGIRVEKAAGK